jgi:hypothetical protein
MTRTFVVPHVRNSAARPSVRREKAEIGNAVRRAGALEGSRPAVRPGHDRQRWSRERFAGVRRGWMGVSRPNAVTAGLGVAVTETTVTGAGDAAQRGRPRWRRVDRTREEVPRCETRSLVRRGCRDQCGPREARGGDRRGDRVRAACAACADACLSEESVADLASCVRTDLDCADVCAVTARVLSRHTGYDAMVSRALLEACVTVRVQTAPPRRHRARSPLSAIFAAHRRSVSSSASDSAGSRPGGRVTSGRTIRYLTERHQRWTGARQ